MSYRASISVLTAVALAVSLAPAAVAGQEQGAAATPRTPWGHPDLQGAWTNRTITPLERADELGDREIFTEEEAAARDLESATRADRRQERGTVADIGAYNAFWFERGETLDSLRASLIVDPPNGKMPPLTPQAERRAEEQREARAASRDVPVGSWIELDEYDRCIIRATVPRVSTAYNNNYEIVQTPDYVGIFQEQMHEVRIIPLDGRPHVAPNVLQWLGDSRGRWEGDTLVVETDNLSGAAMFQGSGEGRHVVERFRRVDKDTLEYEFTVSDPATWTRSWTARWPWKTTEALYEYACHEGNYSLVNMLSGARVQEEAAAEAVGTQSQR
jgi:hypothetical protein